MSVSNIVLRAGVGPTATIGLFVTHGLAPGIAVITYPEQPIYADQSRPNLRGQADFTFGPPHAVSQSSVNSWYPRYPDAAPLSLKQPTSGGAVEPVLPLNFKLPWLPNYSDQKRPYERQQVDFTFEPILKISVLLPWLPDYNDQARPNLRGQADFKFDAPHPLNFKLPWLPRYQDQPPPVISVSTREADKIFSTATVVNLPWLPDYPDLYREPPRVKGESFFTPYHYVENLQWLPEYLDLARPNWREQLDFWFETVPPPPRVTRIDWLPRYPDKYPGNPLSYALLAGYVWPFLPPIITPAGRIIDPALVARGLSPQGISRALGLQQASRSVTLQQGSRIISPSSTNRIL